MHPLLELLASGSPIVADGAMGTMLQAAGLESGEVPETWNTRPDRRDRVAAVHAAYLRAGSQIVLTNTFGGSAIRLAQRGLELRADELNRAAAELGREAVERWVAGQGAKEQWADRLAARRPLVAGSMGPTGEILEPFGRLSLDAAREAFAVQAGALAAGGAELIWIETMIDLAEAVAALEGAQLGAPELPVAATMTFDARGFTMMGTGAAEAARTLHALGAAAVGANCGAGPADAEGALALMRVAVPEAVLVSKPNAGLPRMIGGRAAYDLAPEALGEHAARAVAAGARIVGGCCGTTPEHVRAIAAAIGEPPLRRR